MAFIERHIPKHRIIRDQCVTAQHKKRSQHWWLLAFTLLLLSIFFSIKAGAQEDAPHAGILRTQTPLGAEISTLLLKTHADVEINGMVATVRYTQLFKNDTDNWLDGKYTFPLPEKAAIKKMQIRLGEELILGEIKTLPEAKKMYDQARRSGKTAALTEQHRPNMFTQNITNIEPHSEIEVTLEYQEIVSYQLGEFSWRLPTTFTPRYTPKPPALSIEEDSPVSFPGWFFPDDIAIITPPLKNLSRHERPLTMNITLHSGFALAHVDSLFHEIYISKRQHKHRITLSQGATEMNRDFVLQWAGTNRSTPEAAIFTDTVDGEAYALLMLVPPTENNSDRHLPRDIVFVIDVSGSMKGSAIEQAKASLQLAVNDLNDHDRFNVVAFNSRYTTLFNELQPADQYHIDHATQWIQNLQASGGTEMLGALNAAFGHLQRDTHLQQLVFITDGAVSNEKQLFSHIHEKIGSSRLFTVGIGSAPNGYFMKKAAAFGGGEAIFIGDTAEVSPKMNALFGKLRGTIATNIQVNWGTHTEQFPRNIGDLYQRSPLLLSAKLDNPLSSVTITGETAGNAWQRVLSVQSATDSQGLSQLWARAKIESIEDQRITGKISEQECKERIETLALQHSLLSRFTHFIAIDHRPRRPASETLRHEQLANPVAKGQHLRSITFPQTATTAEIGWWFGLFGFFGLIIIRSLKGE